MAWSSVDAFVDDVRRSGHPGPQRIVTAALVRCAVHLRERGRAVPDLQLAWSTGIPRSVGLAGSSAIAVGVIDAVAAAADHHLDPLVVAALALDAEVTELGIAAGWQDRVVQSVGRPVLVDTAEMLERDGTVVPTVRELRPATPLRLVVGWDPSSASDSGRYHGSLRRRADEISAAMAELAELARRSADALEAGALGTFADGVDRTWRIRRRAVPLRPDHAALVDAVGATGVAATTPGSGGSVVAVVADAAAGADEIRVVTELLGARGASWWVVV